MILLLQLVQLSVFVFATLVTHDLELLSADVLKPYPEPIYCTMDVRQCPDGTYVGRDPNNGCQFFPCPIWCPGGQFYDGCHSACPNICGEAPSPICTRNCVAGCQCPQELWWDARTGQCVKESQCSWDGCTCGEECYRNGVSGVCQADNNTCAVNILPPICCGAGYNTCQNDYQCSYDQSCIEGCCVEQCNGYSTCQNNNQCGYGQSCEDGCCIEDVQGCPDDGKICPNGTVVGRDPDNNCEWFPCPDKCDVGVLDGRGRMLCLQNDCCIQNNTCVEECDCTDDVRYCPDLSTVGRDPNNNCEFFPCPCDNPCTDENVYQRCGYAQSCVDGCCVRDYAFDELDIVGDVLEVVGRL